MKQSITPKQVVAFLNSMLKKDPEAISVLFMHGENCNEKVIKSKAFVVVSPLVSANIRLIGLLNGMFCENRKEPAAIVMCHNGKGRVVQFKMVSKKDIASKIGAREVPFCPRTHSEFFLAV